MKNVYEADLQACEIAKHKIIPTFLVSFSLVNIFLNKSVEWVVESVTK